MLHKTKGIVLNYIKYRETSIIVRIYTELFGLQSYIINGVRSKKAKHKIALFQPLTLLDLVVYKKENANLHRIAELKCDAPFTTLPFDFKKSGIALFITEVLLKSIKGEEENPILFEFLYKSILIFDNLEKHYENFHLQFLIKLSRYLGFGPEGSNEFFDQIFLHTNIREIAELEKKAFDQLMKIPYQNEVKIPNAIRRELIELILKFYGLHIENFGEVKSLAILKEVMS
jgi:DNA repair protein RecO (recombination protein O)